MSEHVKQVPDLLNHDFIDEVLRDGIGIGGNMNEFAFLDENLFPELDPLFENSPMPEPMEPTANWLETSDLQHVPEFINMQPLDSALLVPVPVVADVPCGVTITGTEAAVNLDSPDVTIEVQSAEEELGAAAVPKEESSEGASPSRGSSDPPKKRGRKRLYPPGTTPPRRRRPRKVKLYERETFEDPDLERKRQNALNAKIHREKQKEKKEALQGQLKAALRDRDELRRQLELMREREKKLVRELELIRQQHNTTTVFPVKIIY